jgi:membrane protein
MAQKLLDLVVETIKEWQEDGASRLAAALAYYTTFSLAPLLVDVIAIAGFLAGGMQPRAS